ncbi:hypothetical protein [uncultured Algimonas sp.]|uniref:hypothetical protein n=1 Tax=uncultured Algimonas sp. TaxID=1547920 RepID=UPI0026275D28|nr:hypothetical protein [uncultured Algimonas sp.]
MPKTRIMYMEDKSGGLVGPARIGRVTFSKSGKSIRYGGRLFLRLGGQGCKANYFDAETREPFWISGPRRDGKDQLYPDKPNRTEIDADVADEYWSEIRGKTPGA